MHSPVYSREPNGKIKIGHYVLDDLVERFGSPLYIYHFAHLRQRYRRLQSQFHPAIHLYYAIKANPNPAIIRQYVEMGAGFDLSSVEEMQLALAQGCEPSRMSFAGPGKRGEELRETLTARIGSVSIESLSELKNIIAIALDLKRPVTVTLRINPARRTQGFAIKMGGIPSPFGIDEEHFNEIVNLVRKSEMVEIKGLHIFSGTQSLDEKAIIENIQNTLRLAEHFCASYGIRFEMINLGGGFGVPYHQNEEEIDENRLTSGINDAINTYLRQRPGTRFILELGRYLIASCGIYVASVIRKKESRGAKFLVLDGGMNHYLAASGNLGQILRKNFPLLHHSKTGRYEDDEKYHVVGPLCTPIDRMATDLQLPFTEEGDMLVFPLAGAYSYTASPLQFLSHPAPAEVAVDGQEVLSIRDRIVNWYKMDQK